MQDQAERPERGRGRDLLSQKDCDTCHDFDGEGENDGPNLKGRGTAKWVAAVTCRWPPGGARKSATRDDASPTSGAMISA